MATKKKRKLSFSKLLLKADPMNWSKRSILGDVHAIVYGARLNADEYIAMMQHESNIFGDPEAKIDPEWHEPIIELKGGARWWNERKQLQCCITQQLVAEKLGLV